jgi:hypothetical protein
MLPRLQAKASTKPKLSSPQHCPANAWGLFDFFNASPKRVALKELYSVYAENAKLKVIAVHAIRLGVADCIARFLKLYPVVTSQ